MSKTRKLVCLLLSYVFGIELLLIVLAIDIDNRLLGLCSTIAALVTYVLALFIIWWPINPFNPFDRRL